MKRLRLPCPVPDVRCPMPAVCLVLSLVFCPSSCARPPARDAGIVIALANSPTNLDPGVGLDEASQKMHQLLYSSLVKIDASLRVVPDLLVPAYGIYAGWAAGHRAAVSIGTNPHYGGSERRVEAFLLDFEGDLYGERLIVELWRRLREERAFANEDELVAQITQDVEATRAAERPL